MISTIVFGARKMFSNLDLLCEFSINKIFPTLPEGNYRIKLVHFEINIF